MIQLRVVSPSELTGGLFDDLAANSTVLNLSVTTKATHNPDGDLIQFDVVGEALNRTLEAW